MLEQSMFAGQPLEPESDPCMAIAQWTDVLIEGLLFTPNVQTPTQACDALPSHDECFAR